MRVHEGPGTMLGDWDGRFLCLVPALTVSTVGSWVEFGTVKTGGLLLLGAGATGSEGGGSGEDFLGE